MASKKDSAIAKQKENENPLSNLEGPTTLDCAVCLQTCVHPCQLPCGHIFCFLCVKGVSLQSKRCAMCRHEIPPDYIEKPRLLQTPQNSEPFAGGYQWFYEGYNGWWQYDERTSKELEMAYNRGERTCDLLIAGLLYVADFDAMLQLRQNDPGRRRRIKRDLVTIPKKGVAGIRIANTDTNRMEATITRTNEVVATEVGEENDVQVSTRQAIVENYENILLGRQRSHSESQIDRHNSVEVLSDPSSTP